MVESEHNGTIGIRTAKRGRKNAPVFLRFDMNPVSEPFFRSISGWLSWKRKALSFRIGSLASSSVTLGVRPEHLIPDQKGPIKIDIEMLEQLGAPTLVHGFLEGTVRELCRSFNSRKRTAA